MFKILMTCVSRVSDLDKVQILSGIDGMGIPIASAILTVCYPKAFTVVDQRACAALAKLLGVDQKALRKQLGGDPAGKPEAYLAYVEKCKAESASRGLELRAFDRMLWGMDFYEGKGGLKELAAGLKYPSLNDLAPRLVGGGSSIRRDVHRVSSLF